MAIEIKYALNMALQYNNANEFDIQDYLLADNETGKLFLTESPTKRVLNEAEKSALYFLIDDDLFNASAFYEMYNSSGEKIDQVLLEMGYNHLIHNAIPVNLDSFYVDPEVSRIDVSIVSNQDFITNGDFEQGAGNVFTGWTISTAGLSTITQTVDGGLDGSRGVVMFQSPDGELCQISQTVLVVAQSYTVGIWAKATTGNPLLQFTDGVNVLFQSGLTSEFEWYSFTFTAAGTSLNIRNGVSGSSLNSTQIIDNVSVTPSITNRLTEIKSYEIDRECYNYTFQVNWLNKLGGRDTFMFGASPIIGTTVDRNNLIELSKLRNFESPKRIYGYREHISYKTYSIAQHCKDRATAEWLKRELIDSIDVMLVVNDYYYPVMVTNSSVEEDKVSHDYKVNLSFRLAFDNNIQTR